MELKIKTSKLQDLVTKSMNGVGNNKLLPITSMLIIELKDNKLTFRTTDSNNTLIIKDTAEGEDLYAVVNADLFNKLISKLTTEFTELKVTDRTLEVKANGNYILDLQFDEDGGMVKLPEPQFRGEIVEEATISRTAINTIIANNRDALAKTLDLPVYTAYYVGDKVISTDTTIICEYVNKLLQNPVLMSKEFVDLLEVVTDDKLTISITPEDVKVVTKGEEIYGQLVLGIEDYQIGAINGLLEQQMPSSCEVNRVDLLNALDRLSMFVGPYDNGALKLDFDGFHSIKITSVQATAIEEIKTLTNDINSVAFNCLINVSVLTNQIKSFDDTTLKIEYGVKKALKILTKDVVKVVALLAD